MHRRNGGGNGLADDRQVRLRRVGKELVSLLANEFEYRMQWERRAMRASGVAVSYTAIARVLVDWWFDTGDGKWDGRGLPLDLVRRALTGEVLTPQTLDHIIRAFDLQSHHEQRLWDLYCGCPSTSNGSQSVVSRVDGSGQA